jgi:hypothetical protein
VGALAPAYSTILPRPDVTANTQIRTLRKEGKGRKAKKASSHPPLNVRLVALHGGERADVMVEGRKLTQRTGSVCARVADKGILRPFFLTSGRRPDPGQIATVPFHEQ